MIEVYLVAVTVILAVIMLIQFSIIRSFWKLYHRIVELEERDKILKLVPTEVELAARVLKVENELTSLLTSHGWGRLK